jgi:hypothetical protein
MPKRLMMTVNNAAGMPKTIELVRHVTKINPANVRRYALGNRSLTTPVKRTAHRQMRIINRMIGRFPERVRLKESLKNLLRAIAIFIANII